MQKRILIFGLVLCLILLSGWMGKALPSQSIGNGDFIYQLGGQTGGAGMKSLPGTDRTVILSGNDVTVFRSAGEEQALAVSQLVVYGISCELIGKQTASLPDGFGNDQLDLIVVAPRA